MKSNLLFLKNVPSRSLDECFDLNTFSYRTKPSTWSCGTLRFCFLPKFRMNEFFFGRGWGMTKWTGIQEWRCYHATCNSRGFFFLILYFRPSAGRPWKGPWVLFGTLWLKYLLVTLHRFVIENNRYYRYSIVDNEAYPGHLSWRRWLIFSRSGLPAMFSRKRNDLAQYFNHKINPLTTWFFSQTRWLDIGVLCILW